MPFVGCHAGSLLGVSASEYLKSDALIVKGVSKAVELYRPDGARYATIEGSVDEESGRIAATASLTSDAEAEVTLYGYFFQRDEADNPKLRREEDLSVLLTDGWTTFGIAVPARRD